MRFKRNYVTIAYSFVYIMLMLLCSLTVAALSYELFAEDGMGVIFAILMTIGVILVFIGSFFLREKAVLRFIQKKNSGLFEGIAAVVLIGMGFFLITDLSSESALWYGAFLAFTYGVCRLLGGRLCGLLGLVITLALTYFALSTGWAVFDSSEIISILCILVPFFVFLLLMKNIIPQFGQSDAVVLFALAVLCALFGAFICLNPLTLILLIGCAISLLFANLRSVDSFVTKGPFMAGFLVVVSGVFTVGMSFLLEKDLGSLIPSVEPGFEAASASGSVLDYFIDKLHNMLSTVIFHAFDYGIFSILLLIFATMAGVYAIRRKLSAIGPILLVTIFALIGYAMYDIPEAHGYYLTYMLGLLAAYGLFNMLLPEFLDKYDDEEDEEDMYETETDTDAVPSIDEIVPDPIVKEKVAVENRESSKSDSDTVSVAASAVEDKVPTPEQVTPSIDVKDDLEEATHIDNAENSYMEWHVSNEFVREDELRKEREAAREKDIEVAKEIKEAKDSGKSEEEIQAIAETAEEEKKQTAPGRVLFTGEDTHPSAETISASVPPMSIRPVDTHVSDPNDVSQLENVGMASDDQLHGASRAESDSIVLSGYQNSGNFSAPVDIITAIDKTEIPQVEIPDVPQVEESDSSEDTQVEEVAAAAAETSTEANEAVEELSKAAASFNVENTDKAVEPDDQQLDNLLERLDVSDSIKRMSESAREDMADVIEHADDKTEAEVVLKNEDYKFGTGDGEYGDVPTISELEDRWRAEEKLKETPDDMVPDVVSPEDTIEETTEDIAEPVSEEKAEEMSGYEEKGAATTPVSLDAPVGPTDPTMDMLSFDSVANTSEEKLDQKPIEPENEDVSLDRFEFTQAEPDDDGLDIIKSEDITDHEEEIAEKLGSEPEDMFTFTSASDEPIISAETEAEPILDLEPEIEPEPEFVSETEPVLELEPAVEEFVPMPNAAIMEEVIPEIPEEEVEEEPVLEAEADDAFVSFRDMASATVPEEILPITSVTEEEANPAVAPESTDDGFTFDMLGGSSDDIITPSAPTDDMSGDVSDVTSDDTLDITPTDAEETVSEFVEEAPVEVEEPKITKFEPERIERPENLAPKAEKKVAPAPIINHTEQSPVYSFTRSDAGVSVPKEDDELLFIPKPRPIAVDDSKQMMPVADDESEETVKKNDNFHTEEVVTRSGGGSRSYHKIVIK